MKRAILLALCLMLAGLLAVNGSFAAEFTQAVEDVVSSLFETVGGLVNPDPTADPDIFDVSIVYPEGSEELPMLSPGRTIDRNVAVYNASSQNAAYFRIAFAVQAEAFPHLTLEFNETDYTWLNGWRDIDIDGRDYKLMIGSYKQALVAGATSPAALLRVAMSEKVTSEQMGTFENDFLQIQALAIEAAAFSESYATAEDALEAALPLEGLNPF